MYDNSYTRANPGLIIFMVDQSASMSQIGYEGRSLAETAADIINRMIAELGLIFTSGNNIKDSANIVILGYGGTKDSMEVELLRTGSIKTLCTDGTIPVQHLKQMIPDGAGGTITIDLELKQFVTPKAVWKKPMGDAFAVGSALVNEWVNRAKETIDEDGNPFTRDDILDPIPLIINISDGEPIDCEADVRKYANEIMNINSPDGNPLIVNILTTANESDCIFLPTAKELDELQGRKIINDSSSNLPNELINTFKGAGFVDACKDSKLVLINPSNDDIHSLILSLVIKIIKWDSHNPR